MKIPFFNKIVPLWAIALVLATICVSIWYFFFNDKGKTPDKPKDVTVSSEKKKLMFMPGVGTVAVPEEVAYN
jgi:hypothetical protein